MKIVVLGGGDSPEREVSLRSSAAVADAAQAAGYSVVQIDPANGYQQLDNLEGAIVLPILHGKNGEDGVVQKELENRGLLYLGTNSVNSAACFDKWQTRQILTAAGVPMPKAEKVNKATYKKSKLSFGHHVLKIIHGGSSIGTLIVRSEKLNESDVAEIFAMENNAVVEELIDGTEITVPVLGKQALPVIEIRPPKDAEFNYENKYNGSTAELCPPQSVSADLQKKAQALAEKVHGLMGARHLSRTDMMIDGAGDIYVLEINTMPGMTNQSLYPKSAAVAGLDMTKLVAKFINMVNE